MQTKAIKKVSQIGLVIFSGVLLLAMLLVSTQLAGQVYAGETTGTPPRPTEIPRGDNLLYNGSFEFGYYPVPELGFEAPDIGNIPIKWGWFRSSAYGKYDIDNNLGFGIICPDDDILGTASRNTLAVFMQSTDQPDARLGIYQTVDVVPGQDYLFSISGTIQVQKGGSSPDINHLVEVAFDQTGGVDWTAVPQKQWALLPWKEQALEFNLSGPDDPDLAKIQDYYTIVKARSNKMTVFIAGWRRWPNWRMGVFTLDCASLVPLNKVTNLPEILPKISDLSTTTVDKALGAAFLQTEPGTTTIRLITTTNETPANDTTTGNMTTNEITSSTDSPAATPSAVPKPADIPASGGILDLKENSLLITIVAGVVIAGLAGAGIWNIWRKRQN